MGKSPLILFTVKRLEFNNNSLADLKPLLLLRESGYGLILRCFILDRKGR